MIFKFVQKNSNTNVIILSVPQHHDLEGASANNEIYKFNRKLMKIMRHFNHAVLIEVDYQRGYYTRHGQHLNTRGKELLSKQIAYQIYALLEDKEELPVRLKWTAEFV
jgi:hypothetical protein